MHRSLTCLLGIGICSIGASGEPQVVRFDQDAHFNPGSDSIDLLALDATAPDINLAFFGNDPGGGSNASVWLPSLEAMGAGGISALEANVGPGKTGNSNYDFPHRYDELFEGDLSSAATPGAWGTPDRDTYSGAAPDNYPLEFIAYEYSELYATCRFCPIVHEMWEVVPGVKHIALRWTVGGEVYYGWVAFAVRLNEYPPSCRGDIDFCPDSTFDGLYRLDLRYVAAGWETEPDTPIVVGGGLCQADLNFDARVNFFDISEFITLYNSGDPAADLDPNGVLNFFDVAAYIGLYNEPCD